MNKNLFSPTPPMGWNSYDCYCASVNEEQVKANARAMADKLKDYGWEYVVIDIEWYSHNAGSMPQFQYIPFGSVEMDEYSRLLPDPERFPSSVNGQGFKPLADYIHSLGLKFGIHIMRGIHRAAAHERRKILGSDLTADMVAEPNSVCRWNPDMYGVQDIPQGQAYYNSIIELYASWGVDFIKCDDICNTDNLEFHSEKGYARKHEIEMLYNAIQKAGRPIVLSLSPGPAIIQKSWHYKKYANMWRISDDFWDDWELLKDMFPRCEIWQDHVAKGCFPDCDMLPLGKIGGGFGWQKDRDTNLTKDEQRVMITLWCMFGSPLMLGADLTRLDDWTLSLLTNRKVLNMLTPDCRPDQICRDGNKAIWAAENEKTSERYVALFNLSDQAVDIMADLHDRWDNITGAEELWGGLAPKIQGGNLTAQVVPHGCLVYKVE